MVGKRLDIVYQVDRALIMLGASRTLEVIRNISNGELREQFEEVYKQRVSYYDKM